MATNYTPTAGAALGNELRAGTVAKVGSTKRIQELNGMLHSNRPNVDITRARAYTKVYRETEGMPSMLRRYKASAEVYRSLSDNVYDHEQLVGWPTKRIRGANFAIELHAHWLADDLPNLRGRTYDPFEITDEEYKELEEDLLPYWKEKTMAVQWGHYVDPKEWDRAQFGGVSDVSNYLCANGSHFIPSWTDVIEHGFVKYYEKAKALRADLDPNDPESVDKRIFYNGIIEVLEAIRDWGERMSAACARKAAQEKDPVRKQELEKMAEMMTRVPWGPATSFYDACETAWAVHHLGTVRPVYVSVLQSRHRKGHPDAGERHGADRGAVCAGDLQRVVPVYPDGLYLWRVLPLSPFGCGRPGREGEGCVQRAFLPVPAGDAVREDHLSGGVADAAPENTGRSAVRSL